MGRVNGQAAGVVACIVGNDLRGRRSGLVDLLAVSSDARGQGLGTGLLRAGLRWMLRAGCEEVWVDTQGSDRTSLHVYQDAGFATEYVNLDLHLWLES